MDQHGLELNAHDVRRVAVEACADPKTIKRFLAGGDVRPTTAVRVRAAIERLKLAQRRRGGKARG